MVFGKFWAPARDAPTIIWGIFGKIAHISGKIAYVWLRMGVSAKKPLPFASFYVEYNSDFPKGMVSVDYKKRHKAQGISEGFAFGEAVLLLKNILDSGV